MAQSDEKPLSLKVQDEDTQSLVTRIRGTHGSFRHGAASETSLFGDSDDETSDEGVFQPQTVSKRSPEPSPHPSTLSEEDYMQAAMANLRKAVALGFLRPR